MVLPPCENTLHNHSKAVSLSRRKEVLFFKMLEHRYHHEMHDFGMLSYHLKIFLCRREAFTVWLAEAQPAQFFFFLNGQLSCPNWHHIPVSPRVHNGWHIGVLLSILKNKQQMWYFEGREWSGWIAFLLISMGKEDLRSVSFELHARMTSEIWEYFLCRG